MSSKLKNVFIDLYAAAQVLRNAGFSYDEVSINRGILDPQGFPCWGVMLETQNKTFAMWVVRENVTTVEPQEFLDRWNQWIRRINSDKKLQKKIEKSVKATPAWLGKVAILGAVTAKGIEIPGPGADLEWN